MDAEAQTVDRTPMSKVVSIGPALRVRDELVEAHLHLVPPIARFLASSLPPSFDVDDLVAAGNLGLLHAASRFQPGRDIPFPSYARQCIRGFILNSVKRAKYRDATNEDVEAIPERGKLFAFPDHSLQKRIDTAIAQLSPRLREVIELYYSREQLTHEEVAARVRARHAANGTVLRFHKDRAKQLHNEAIRMLRDLLKYAA
jgi:RNA polymerase sigma factor (sigma-70 family)